MDGARRRGDGVRKCEPHVVLLCRRRAEYERQDAAHQCQKFEPSDEALSAGNGAVCEECSWEGEVGEGEGEADV